LNDQEQEAEAGVRSRAGAGTEKLKHSAAWLAALPHSVRKASGFPISIHYLLGYASCGIAAEHLRSTTESQRLSARNAAKPRTMLAVFVWVGELSALENRVNRIIS